MSQGILKFFGRIVLQIMIYLVSQDCNGQIWENDGYKFGKVQVLMDLQFDVLDGELNEIYSDCQRDKLQTVRARSLIDACVERYAQGDPELKRTISGIIDPSGSNPRLSRSCFKNVMTDLIMRHQELPAGDCDSRTESQQFTAWSPVDSGYRELKNNIACSGGFNIDSDTDPSTVIQDSLIRVVETLKTKNESLEMDLFKAEENMRLLEEGARKLRLETNNIKKNFANEIDSLKNMLNEAQDKYVRLHEKYENSVSRNSKLIDDIRNCKKDEERIELEKNIGECQMNLKEKSKEILYLQDLSHVLYEQLAETLQKKTETINEIDFLKTEIEGLIENQKKNLERISALEEDKEALRTELLQAKAIIAEKIPLINSKYMHGSDKHFIANSSLLEEIREVDTNSNIMEYYSGDYSDGLILVNEDSGLQEKKFVHEESSRIGLSMSKFSIFSDCERSISIGVQVEENRYSRSVTSEYEMDSDDSQVKVHLATTEGFVRSKEDNVLEPIYVSSFRGIYVNEFEDGNPRDPWILRKLFTCLLGIPLYGSDSNGYQMTNPKRSRTTHSRQMFSNKRNSGILKWFVKGFFLLFLLTMFILLNISLLLVGENYNSLTANRYFNLPIDFRRLGVPPPL